MKPTLRFRNFLLLFSLAAVIILLLIISSLMYNKTATFIGDKMDVVNRFRIDQITSDIGRTFDEARQTLDVLRQNDRLVRYVRDLEAEQTDDYAKVALSTNLEELLYNVKRDNDFIRNLIVVTPKTHYSSDKTYFDFFLDGFSGRIASDSVVFSSSGDPTPLLQRDQNEMDTTRLEKAEKELKQDYLMASNLTDSSGNRYGIIVMLLDTHIFQSQLADSANLALLNKQGVTIFVGDSLKLMQATPTEGKINYRDIGFEGIRLAYMDRQTFKTKQRSSIGKLTVYALIGCLLLAYCCSRLMARGIWLPVQKLIGQMKQVEEWGDRIHIEQATSRNIRWLPLRDRMFLYLLITVLLPVTVFVVAFYAQTSKIVLEESKAVYTTVFQNTAHRLELYLRAKEQVLSRLASDMLIREYVVNPAERNPDTLQQLAYDDNRLSMGQDEIRLYTRRNELVFSSDNKRKVPMVTELFEETTAVNRKYPIFWRERDTSGGTVASLTRPIFQFTGEPIDYSVGYMKLDLDATYLLQAYADFRQYGGEVFIKDSSDIIWSHPNPSMIGLSADISQLEHEEGRRGRDKPLYFTEPIQGTPWTLMATLNNDLVAKETDTLLYDDIYIAIIVLLLVVLFSFFMSRYLLSPLNRLGVLSGESDPSRIAAVQSVPSYGIHEVDQLQIAFNSMMERIETLVEESYLASKKQLRLEYEKRDTEILALQAHFHPHFLYNTLEKIVNLVESDEKERAVDMIGLLSRLFRYSISQPTVKVTVMEELSYARTYVTLMSYRFKDRISCSWHMDEGARNSQVIKLLLQPILENVFQHATQGNTDVVQVDVACRDLVSQIEISVTDNGPGMSDQQLEELKMNISQNSHHRIGLANVNSRIRLHYGPSYGLDITSRTDYGTVVRIMIPKLLKSD